jgi:hypothetical protein
MTLSEQYRGAAAHLNTIAEQLTTEQADPNLGANLTRVFDELTASEPSHSIRQALAGLAQNLVSPADPEKLRHAAIQLNRVADNYDSLQAQQRNLWS